jgi:hypothetical protein
VVVRPIRRLQIEQLADAMMAKPPKRARPKKWDGDNERSI